ncbi:MAG TPA: hypothetical protein PL110_05065 [Candidatus Eremiobacteraeota bacterium]|nr:MAG: hypothetical protein BWY64_00670 [bacterium ADurb.Bin363]HPZ07461.1 hypothetical protein [Candidatus Eremiobacteraeota bacterium]
MDEHKNIYPEKDWIVEVTNDYNAYDKLYGNVYDEKGKKIIPHETRLGFYKRIGDKEKPFICIHPDVYLCAGGMGKFNHQLQGKVAMVHEINHAIRKGFAVWIGNEKEQRKIEDGIAEIKARVWVLRKEKVNYNELARLQSYREESGMMLMQLMRMYEKNKNKLQDVTIKEFILNELEWTRSEQDEKKLHTWQKQLNMKDDYRAFLPLLENYDIIKKGSIREKEKDEVFREAIEKTNENYVILEVMKWFLEGL